MDAASDDWTKIGVIVPSSNTSVEIDFRRAALPGVSIHSARMWLTGSDADGLDRMNEDVETAARHLGSTDMKLLVYACTGGSLLKGIGYDRALAKEISVMAGGVPAITTSSAALEALEALGLKRLSLLTPYPATMTRMVKEFLEGNGHEVLSVAGRGHGSNLEIGDDPVDAIVEFAQSNQAADADGFFCSCTNWRSMAAAEAIERETGKPVVTSNLATIWSAYRMLGLDAKIEGYGRLLRGS